MKELSKVRIGYSKLSGEIYLYVPDKKGLAKIKKPCEADLMCALVGHMFHDAEQANAIEKDVYINDSWYTISIEKIEKPEEEDL
jgi:hypothetical protein